MLDMEAIKNFSIDKSDWKKVKFGDVVFEPKESVKDPVAEGIEHVVGLEHIDSEDMHLRRSASIEESTTFTKKFSQGDVLFGRRRAYLRKAAKTSFEGICSGDITVMRAREELLLPELLPFIVNNEKFFDHAVTHSAGGLSPRVKFKDLAKFELNLPSPKVQEGLLKLFLSLDEVAEANKLTLQRLRVAKGKDFELLLTQSDGEIMPLSKILKQKKDKSQVPHKRLKYIGLEHIEAGEFHCSKFGDSSEAQAQCYLIDKGDLCYSKLRPYLDKAFIAGFDAVSTTELLVYETTLASKEYVLHHLHSKPFIHYVSGKGFGTKMPRVNHKIVGEYEIKMLSDETAVLDKMALYSRTEKDAIRKINKNIELHRNLINKVF